MKRFLRLLLPCWLLFSLLVLSLDAQSLWWDEGISLHLATSSWAEVVANRAANIHPPLYFFMLKVWVGMAGATPFAARYLSALVTTLLPVAVYAFLHRRVNRRSGRAAALLVALAPPFFFYGQEVRAYAFLPLLWLALLAQVWRVRSASCRAERRWLKKRPFANPAFWAVGLAWVQVVFILTHYTAIVAVGWANIVILVQLLRSRDRRRWRAWGGATALTALLLVPWGGAVLRAQAAGFRADAGLSNPLTERIPWDYLARLLGVFHTVGHPSALHDATLLRLSLLVGCGLLAVLVWAMWRAKFGRGTRDSSQRMQRVFRPMGRLMLIWLLPLTAAPVIWGLSSQAHPRYLLPFVLGAWMLVAAAVTHPWAPRLLRGGVLMVTLVMSILGLRAIITNPYYARSDVRGVAAFIRETAKPGDVVLLPYTDWSLAQYDLGDARRVMIPSPSDDVAVNQAMAEIFMPGAQSQHVYALDYGHDALDPRNQVRAALAWGGMLVERREFHGVFVERYALSAPPSAPACQDLLPVCVKGSSLCLTGTAFREEAVSGAALPVQLCWQGADVQTRYAVALRLYTESGALLASMDDLLLDKDLSPSDYWSDQPVVTYHHLPLPVGLLPQHPVTLEVGIYAVDAPEVLVEWLHGDGTPTPAVTLGAITSLLEPWSAVAADALPMALDDFRVNLSPSLRLVGAAVDRDTVYPGQTFFVWLRWEVLKGGPLDLAQTLILRQAGQDLILHPLLTQLVDSSSILPKGRPLLANVGMMIPADAMDGTAQVLLRSGAREIQLGEVLLRAGEHTFVVPDVPYPVDMRVGKVATLLGFALSPGNRVVAGDALTLTLFWRAEAGAVGTDLTVFTHLVGPDGVIVAQHDGKPVDWQRPTGGWVAGEIIADAHALSWQTDAPGKATLRVGLYDAETGSRVVWEDNDDALVLPVTLEISEK